jgi:hypothetical protein
LSALPAQKFLGQRTIRLTPARTRVIFQNRLRIGWRFTYTHIPRDNRFENKIFQHFSGIIFDLLGQLLRWSCIVITTPSIRNAGFAASRTSRMVIIS